MEMMAKKYPYQQFSLADLEGENWDDIPFLDGAYQISNYGRIKTRRRWIELWGGRGYWLKERIRKVHVQTQIVFGGKRKLYLLGIYIKLEGKRYQVGIARMVYYLFVDQFDLEDRSIVISYRDANPFNIQPDNLWLTNPSENSTRRNPGPDQLHTTVISQYDLTGRKIREYPNLKAASRKTKFKIGTIRGVLSGKTLTAMGYYWQLGPGPSQIAMDHLEESKRRWEKKVFRPVTQYRLDGERIRSYPSLSEAARHLNTKFWNISAALSSKTLQSGNGYFWRYGKGPVRISVPQRLRERYALKEFYKQPVTQYDTQGKRVAVYETIPEAAKKEQVQLHTLVKALTGKALTCGNYYWRLGRAKASITREVKEKEGQKRMRKQSRPVVQYGKSGRKIKEYVSMAAAAKAMGVSPSHIRMAVIGKIPSAKGFYWKLADAY